MIKRRFKLFLGIVLAGLCSAAIATATPVTYDLTNGYQVGSRNEAGFVFTRPGQWMYIDFDAGNLKLTLDDLGAVANIRLTGTAPGHFSQGVNTAANVGTFTEQAGNYSFDYSFQATQITATQYRVSGALVAAGTITNPGGSTLSFPLTPSGGTSFRIDLATIRGVDQITVHGWSYGESAGGDFHFTGARSHGSEVPEPATLGLLSLGLMMNKFRRRNIAS